MLNISAITIVVCLHCLMFTCGGFIQFNDNVKLTLKTCDFSNSYRLYNGATLDECVTDCHLRTYCKHAIYRYNNGVCALVDTLIDASSLGDALPLCFYTKPTEWTYQNLGSCTTNECGDRQMCNSNAVVQSDKCTMSECPTPPTIPNAVVHLRSRNKGSKVAYFCEDGHTPRGNSTITCQEYGTWSTTDFSCAKHCQRPLPVDNAFIAHVSTRDFALGSVLSIECNPGYTNYKSTNITSECTSDSEWSDKIIPCCKEGYTFSWHQRGMSCFKIHEDVQLSSFDEMSEYCTQESPTSQLFFKGNIDHKLQLTENIFETTGTTLDYIMTNVKKSSITNELLKCIGKSTVKIVDHDKERKKNLTSLLNENFPDFNTTSLSYDDLKTTLQNWSQPLWEAHEEFRLNDVISRLNLTSGFVHSENATYTELYAELENVTIDKNDFKDHTYTELSYYIKNNSLAIPPCSKLEKWQDGFPKSEGDCIMTGPASNFTLVDLFCNMTDKPYQVDPDKVGFICWESQRKIQN